MAAFDTHHAQFETVGITHRIGQFFSSMTASFVAWNDARATRAALAALSDRELDDIGLSRSSISQIH